MADPEELALYDNPEDSTFDVNATNKNFEKTENDLVKKIAAMKEDIKKQRKAAYKKAVNQEGVPPHILSGLKKLSADEKVNMGGINGDPIAESLPHLVSAPTDETIKKGGSCIRIGKDNPKGRSSGNYDGHTQAGAIQITAGVGGPNPKQVSDDGQKIFVEQNIQKDPATIYLSQKCDIDGEGYMNTAPGSIGKPKTRSAAVMKADGFRLWASGGGGGKLITGGAKKNSQGGTQKSVVGIDLIAGNDDEKLEPLVLGTSLRGGLNELVDHLSALSGLVDKFLQSQIEYNMVLALHQHTSPFFAIPTLPLPSEPASTGQKTVMTQLAEVKVGIAMFKSNLEMYKFNYLEQCGANFINSRNNHSN
jgi:hypothetical protein